MTTDFEENERVDAIDSTGKWTDAIVFSVSSKEVKITYPELGRKHDETIKSEDVGRRLHKQFRGSDEANPFVKRFGA